MTKYWVLSAIVEHGNCYSGLDRPVYQWSGTETEEFVELAIEIGSDFNRVEDAIRIAEALQDYGIATEVVADTEDSDTFFGGGVVIGYDICYFAYHSMLRDRLESFGADRERIEAPVMHVLREYFAARLNPAGLFTSFRDAAALRDAVLAIKRLVPDSFDDHVGFLPQVRRLDLVWSSNARSSV